MSDLISRQAAIDAIVNTPSEVQNKNNPLVNQYDGATFRQIEILGILEALPSAQPEDYTELKREFLRMASYIDVLLECSDEQKKTLIGFISRLAEFMPWTERD